MGGLQEVSIHQETEILSERERQRGAEQSRGGRGGVKVGNGRRERRFRGTEGEKGDPAEEKDVPIMGTAPNPDLVHAAA